MRHLLQSFAGSLSAGLEADRHEPAAQAPFVYTTAISSNAGLVRSLAGITLIAREMGFEREAETLALADAMGDLSLTLRSLARADDQSGEGDEKNALNQGAAAGVTVVRYGIKGMSTATPSE